MLRASPKGLKFLRVVSPSESPKVMGLMDIHNPDELCCFNGVTHCPWCGKVGHTTSWASFARSVLAAHLPLQSPSATIAKKAANPQGRAAQMSHPHHHNGQHIVH